MKIKVVAEQIFDTDILDAYLAEAIEKIVKGSATEQQKRIVLDTFKAKIRDVAVECSEGNE